MWAEVSEKSSDVIDLTIKYGGGSELWRNFLTQSSEAVAAYEVIAAAHEKLQKATAERLEHHLPDYMVQELRVNLEKTQRELLREWNRTADYLNEMISWLDELKRQKQ